MSKQTPKQDFQMTHCPGPGWTDILAADDIAPPDFVSADHARYLGSAPLDAKRYYDPAFAQLENEKMWPHVWQFAAREEDFPDPADFVVYENAGRSYLIVRQDDGSVRAFHNVCLHRGRKLKTESGYASKFICPFHGFTWNTDGSLRDIPCRWDFDHLSDEKMQLPQAQVARWGGYVFIRESEDGPTLEEFLAPLPEYFKRWRHEECVTVAWVGKVVHANWKITMEAFMESYHAYMTHPQLMPFTGDANAAYHILSDHVNVNYTPFAVPSPHVATKDQTEQTIVDEFKKYNGRSADNYDPEKDKYNIKVPAGKTARQALGAALRVASKDMLGGDYSAVSE